MSSVDGVFADGALSKSASPYAAPRRLQQRAKSGGNSAKKRPKHNKLPLCSILLFDGWPKAPRASAQVTCGW